MPKPKLHDAIYHGKFEEVHNLLKSPEGRALTEEKDGNGRLALHFMACQGSGYDSSTNNKLDLKKKAIMDILLKFNSDGLMVKDEEGNVPLHKTLLHGTPEAAKDLITRRRDSLVVRNAKGMSPVHLFVGDNRHASGKSQKLDLVIENCPEALEVKDKEGKLPIHYAVKANEKLIQEKRKLHKEKELLEISHTEEVEKLVKAKNEQMKKANEQLKQDHFEEKEKLQQSHANEKAQLDKTHTKEKEQLKRVLDKHRLVTNHSRMIEKQIFSRLIRDEGTTIEELKAFATLLNTRIELVQALMPNAKPSSSQCMFPTFIASPDLQRVSLLECIRRLHDELNDLEADLDESSVISNSKGVPEVTIKEEDDSGTRTPARPTKRSRVSLP